MKLPQHMQLGHLLFRQAARLRRAVDAALMEQCGVSLREKELLFQLRRSGGQLRMSEVSRTLMFTDGGATKLIGRLVDKGLVVRRRSDEDQRVVLVEITDRGKAKLSRAILVVSALLKSSLSEGLSAKERATLTRLLEKLSATAEG